VLLVAGAELVVVLLTLVVEVVLTLDVEVLLTLDVEVLLTLVVDDVDLTVEVLKVELAVVDVLVTLVLVELAPPPPPATETWAYNTPRPFVPTYTCPATLPLPTTLLALMAPKPWLPWISTHVAPESALAYSFEPDAPTPKAYTFQTEPSPLPKATCSVLLRLPAPTWTNVVPESVLRNRPASVLTQTSPATAGCATTSLTAVTPVPSEATTLVKVAPVSVLR
jgi:hypothetical protein